MGHCSILRPSWSLWSIRVFSTTPNFPPPPLQIYHLPPGPFNPISLCLTRLVWNRSRPIPQVAGQVSRGSRLSWLSICHPWASNCGIFQVNLLPVVFRELAQLISFTQGPSWGQWPLLQLSLCVVWSLQSPLHPHWNSRLISVSFSPVWDIRPWSILELTAPLWPGPHRRHLWTVPPWSHHQNQLPYPPLLPFWSVSPPPLPCGSLVIAVPSLIAPPVNSRYNGWIWKFHFLGTFSGSGTWALTGLSSRVYCCHCSQGRMYPPHSQTRTWSNRGQTISRRRRPSPWLFFGLADCPDLKMLTLWLLRGTSFLPPLPPQESSGRRQQIPSSSSSVSSVMVWLVVVMQESITKKSLCSLFLWCKKYTESYVDVIQKSNCASWIIFIRQQTRRLMELWRDKTSWVLSHSFYQRKLHFLGLWAFIMHSKVWVAAGVVCTWK